MIQSCNLQLFMEPLYKRYLDVTAVKYYWKRLGLLSNCFEQVQVCIFSNLGFSMFSCIL